MSERSEGIDRRAFVRNAAIGTAVVWSAPAVTTLGPAWAQGSVQPGCRSVFSTDFDSAGPARLNATGTIDGFTVTNGTVDVIGDGYFDFYPGNGLYIDTDGSSSAPSPTIASVPTFGPGAYQVTFVLAGSTRGDTNSVTVTFGTNTEVITLESSAPITTYVRSWVLVAPAQLTLTHSSAIDFYGLILLSADVSACTAA